MEIFGLLMVKCAAFDNVDGRHVADVSFVVLSISDFPNKYQQQQNIDKNGKQ